MAMFHIIAINAKRLVLYQIDQVQINLSAIKLTQNDKS
jgi:hypothetical protein